MESNQLKDILTSNGVKPSFHRISVLKYLTEKKNHPTVEMIFSDISNDIPTLSKTTVYNTLKIFLENNIVQSIPIEDNELRFDATMHMHGHFKCLECGKIFDIKMDDCFIEQNFIDGHKVMESQVHFKGICRNCKS